MASFTYAAKVTPYEKRKEEELAEARQRADAYAAQTGQIYDQALASQQAIANKQANTARKQYDQQFDQNAAQQLANERRLQEQMANMGLERSGYNATNQTALALQRGKADADTRAARQAAVDAIMLNLQQYQAEAQQRQAENVLARQQALEDNAADMAYRMYTDDVSTAQNLQKYVDSHNADIYQLMYNAYNSGQAALGNEYAKQLWRLDENGVIQPGSFNTSGAAAYANRVANYQFSPRTATTQTGGTTGGNTVDQFELENGYPKAADSWVSTARKMVESQDRVSAATFLLNAVMNTPMALNDNQVMAMCASSGVPYSVLTYCIDNNITPKEYYAQNQ